MIAFSERHVEVGNALATLGTEDQFLLRVLPRVELSSLLVKVSPRKVEVACMRSNSFSPSGG
jgi:hypothetical protein